jgi:hypothetical protein
MAKKTEKSMEEVFDKLRKLQGILLDEFEIERELEEIPRELNEFKRKHAKIERAISDKKKSRVTNEELIAQIRGEKEELQRNREKYESQIPLIKTQREYEAITNEIAQIDEKLQNYEDVELEASSQIETLNGELEQQQNVLEELSTLIGEKEKEVADLSKNKEKEHKACLKERDTVAKGLDEEIIYKFEKIVRNKEGIGIVSVKNNVCMGCNMLLPPQFVNDVRREDRLIFCPNCSRILYYRGEEEPAEELII